MRDSKAVPLWDAEKIRCARNAKNMSLRELADKLGCRLQTISEWENDCYQPQNAYQRLLTEFFGKPE